MRHIAEVANYLASNGFGVVGNTLFYDHMPADTEGILLRAPLTGVPVDPYIAGLRKTSLQVIVRASDPDNGSTQAYELFDFLRGVNIEMGEIIARVLFPRHEPIAMPPSDGGYYEYSLNLDFTYHPSAP